MLSNKRQKFEPNFSFYASPPHGTMEKPRQEAGNTTVRRTGQTSTVEHTSTALLRWMVVELKRLLRDVLGEHRETSDLIG